MRTLEILIGLTFVLVGALFVLAGTTTHAATSIHQIYQMLYFICSILCLGFGFNMIKRSV